MNKIIVVISIFTIAFISFTVGYKVGDAHGYNEGYDVGYSYDCREQINTLIKRSDSLDKVVQNLNQSCQQDVVNYHRLVWERRRDSVYKATGKKLPDWETHLQDNQRQVREALRFGKEHGLF